MLVTDENMILGLQILKTKHEDFFGKKKHFIFKVT